MLCRIAAYWLDVVWLAINIPGGSNHYSIKLETYGLLVVNSGDDHFGTAAVARAQQ